MEASPRYSIIMPAYNAGRYIRASIASVLALDSSDWELIVVDDGSRDDTAEIVLAYHDPRIRLLRQENSGQSAAQNLGISAAKGEFLSFLDADDLYFPAALTTLHAILAPCPEAVLAYGTATYIDQLGGTVKEGGRALFATRPSGYVLRHILSGNFILVGACLVRREAVIQAGGFNTEIVMAQDWEFWCRLALLGQFLFAGERPVLQYRLHGASIARTVGVDWQHHLIAMECVFGNSKVQAAVPAGELRRIRRRKQADARLYIASEFLRTYRWSEARKQSLLSLVKNPWRMRAWATLILALARFMPQFVRRRIGASA